MNCQITVTDFVEQGTAVYIKVKVYDYQKNHQYQEELRFLGEMLYGELIHPKKSPLTEECRLEIIAYLRKYFGRYPS
ncbi:hypothetical protein FQV26_15555 [Planococcus sp. CPCC 101016]|uniref:hypothetical protein n=1 Tax=Planococcus sp. CPCC 101016 TaxID=2599617 RepID=UPI0011B4EE8F|nr:hypothetical protein [Planococcus sp. CPCC 101016]TWT04354.1 hypothetical protein FQV26_15555 [Planococcus sp. CPCC 101016]